MILFFCLPFARRVHIIFLHSYFSFGGTITIRRDYDLRPASVHYIRAQSHILDQSEIFNIVGHIICVWTSPENVWIHQKCALYNVHVSEKGEKHETYTYDILCLTRSRMIKYPFKSDIIFRRALNFFLFAVDVYFFSFHFFCTLAFVEFKFRNWHRNEIFFGTTIIHRILLASAPQMCMHNG